MVLVLGITGVKGVRDGDGGVRSFFVRMMLGVPVRLAELLGAILMHGMYIRTSLSKPRRSGVESLIAEL